MSSGELLNRLQIVGKVIVAKNAIPLLDNFLFTVTGSELHIKASDAELTVETVLAIGNEGEDGRIAVPSNKVIELLKQLSEQPVTFNINTQTSAIEISTSTATYSQVGLGATDYPENKTLSADAQTLRMEAETFLAGLAKTAFATGNDELRPVMNGIYVDIEEECLTFVATDSHKLARYTRTDVKAGFRSSFVLNKKPATLLRTMLSKNDGEISITFDKESAVISTPSYTMQCRLVAGMYPQYRSVIPANNPNKVVLNRDEILSAIRRVQIYSDSTSLIRFEISATSMRVAAQDLDFSYQADETVPCQFTGNDMSIGFKSSFFVEVLSNMSANEVVLELADPSRAGLVVPAEQSENEDELMLVMPMKI